MSFNEMYLLALSQGTLLSETFVQKEGETERQGPARNLDYNHYNNVKSRLSLLIF